MADYKITLLKGDGIGPEIVNQAVKVLDKAGEKFGFSVEYDEALLGGCAIDATGVPLPDETVAKCKASDSVLRSARSFCKSSPIRNLWTFKECVSD